MKKINKVLFSILIFIFNIFLYFFSGFYKKNKKLWGFGSLAGKEFRGNSKYLYNYIKKNHKEIEPYWISKSKKIHYELKKKGINSIYAYDLSSFKKICSTSIFFCTHGFADLVLGLTRKAKIVHLGHMTYTIKNNSRIKLLSKKSFLEKIYQTFLYGYYYIRKINFGIYASNFSKVNLNNEDPWYPKDKLTLGLPKSDYLFSIFNKINIKKSDYNLFGKKIPKNEKVILFLPTRRNKKDFHIFKFGFSEKKISTFLNINKCHLFISNHPSNVNKHMPEFNIKNMYVNNYGGALIDDLLGRADLLITDYGSIFADFLIFKKPIIFTKFEHDNYINETGLKINYEDLPGPKVVDWDQLLFYMKELLFNKDSFFLEREKWFYKLYDHKDENSSKRIVNYFINW